MVRGLQPPHRLRRDAVAIAAASLLASLCAPAVLLAQDPTYQDPPTPSEGTGAADPTLAPAPDPAPSLPQETAPSQPADPAQAPAAEDPEPAQGAPLVIASGATTVTMADFSFSPASVSVGVGDTVTWTNAGPAEPHTATGDGFDTGQVAVGSSGSAAFAQAGTFDYVCSLHPDLMSGTVTVAAAGGAEEQGDTGSDVATPDSEAAAVAAPDAAGTASKLPSTGLVAAPLVAIGFGLLALGARLRHRASSFDG